MLSKSCEF